MRALTWHGKHDVRMETVDDEFMAAAKDFISRAHKDKKPFFVWFNPTRMHVYTHIRPEHKGISGPKGNFYADGMVEYDNMVGNLAKHLDDNGWPWPAMMRVMAWKVVPLSTMDKKPNT